MNGQIDSKRIAKNIKELRVKKKLTQEELAEQVGYSRRHIIRLENYGTMNLDIVNIFARIFNVSAISILSN